LFKADVFRCAKTQKLLPKKEGAFVCDRTDKPGSVVYGNLSRPEVALRLKPPLLLHPSSKC